MSGATYCSIGSNFVTVTTDHLAMGAPIIDEFTAQAHIKDLIKSLTKASEQTAITLFDEALHVNSGDLQVYVDLNDNINTKRVIPDTRNFPLTDSFIKGLTVLNPIVSANGDHVSVKTILLKDHSMFATNRYLLAEFWHGMPISSVGIQLSKKMVDIIVKCKKPLSSIGFCDTSATIYFSDNSWIMCRQGKEKWYSVDGILPTGEAPLIEHHFGLACGAVLPFCTDIVHCLNNGLTSDTSSSKGASYPCHGLPDGAIFGAKDLAFLAKNATHIDWKDSKKVAFFGDMLRGVLCDRNEV